MLAKSVMLQKMLQVQTDGTSVVSSWAGGRPGLPICSSWGQAVQYLDFKKVHKVCIPAGLCTALGRASGNKHDSEQGWQSRILCTKLFECTDYVFGFIAAAKSKVWPDSLERQHRVGQGSLLAIHLQQVMYLKGWDDAMSRCGQVHQMAKHALL